MKSVCNRWKKGAAALAFAALALAALFAVQEALIPKGGCIDGFYDEPADSIDVVFLGSSHANAAFAPTQLWEDHGFTSYVLYSWSQPLWTSYCYLQEALRTQSPKAVVLEGFGITYGSSYIAAEDIDGVSDQYSLLIPPSVNRLELSLAMARCQRTAGPFYRYQPLYRYHTRWKTVTWEEATWWFRDHRTTGKGFGALTGSESFPEPQIPAALPEPQIDAYSEEYLCKIIELCQKKDLPLLVALVPYEVSAQDLANFAYLKDLCARYGVPVLDYTTPAGRDIGFDWGSDLADHAHVNVDGAAKITADLGAYLAQQLELPDHRGDAAYAGWEEAARIENRDAKDMQLRLTLDIGRYFVRLAEDEALAAAITTMGDATGADTAAAQAAFAALGLDAAPLLESGVQGLYLIDGGAVTKNETGPGPLTAEVQWGDHTVTLTSSVEASRMAVDGEEKSRNRPGVNVLVYDKVTGEVIHSISFSTMHEYAGYTE